MGERLFGIETEYALSATDARGARASQGRALDDLMRSARRRLPHLPDELSRGLFLQNGARFYVDCGGHPEMTTPECSNPWDVVRYLRAGESILLRLAGDTTGQRLSGRMAFFRCNVDYSGTRATWGSHESYMHRVQAETLSQEIIPHLVSRLVYTGAGGFKNTSPGLEFTLSPRTAHIATSVSHESTSNRGIFHTKDEPLCGNGYHRLHLTCGESLCSDLATWLRVGTTALVVAMCEVGLRPGEAVALRSPVDAMRLYAGDPTCTAVAETRDGRRLTALDVQRHYLEQAEAHAGDAFMPAWAGEVCRRWHAVLDCLEGGWESAATTLDWAIKLRLYRDRVRRRGLEWESLGSWTQVVERLSLALTRAKRASWTLAAEVALGSASAIAADLEQMTPVIRGLGLRWEDLGPFLALRDELFEIDTRFGQLGGDGIFTALDQAAILTHHVDGVDGVEHAAEHPPDVARARLRGQLVRELSGNGERYSCDWDGVWDCTEKKRIDLGDPFQAVAEWKDWPGDDEGVSIHRLVSGMERRLFLSRAMRLRMGADETAADAAEGTPDPVDLNQEALACRQQDQLDEAERLLRQAIEIEDARVPADSPKRPHRRNNLAMVLMRAGNLAEAGRWNADAWRLKATGQHDVTSGRILFVRVALRFLQNDRDVALYLGQLKTLLGQGPLQCLGDIQATWDIPDVLRMLCDRLAAPESDLLAQIAAALNDNDDLAELEALDAWAVAEAVPLEAPWPDG